MVPYSYIVFVHRAKPETSCVRFVLISIKDRWQAHYTVSATIYELDPITLITCQPSNSSETLALLRTVLSVFQLKPDWMWISTPKSHMRLNMLRFYYLKPLLSALINLSVNRAQYMNENFSVSPPPSHTLISKTTHVFITMEQKLAHIYC